jgi:hypothetical protein
LGVIVLLPPGRAGPATDAERAAAEAEGSRVLVIRPDAESEAARGPNSQDLSRLPGTVEAALRQGAAAATAVRALWATP